MTAFTYTWNATFTATPADSENWTLGAQRIRETRAATGERLAVDHSLAGNADDGKHLRVTLIPRASAVALPLDATNGALFIAPIGGLNEVFYQDSAGTVTQMTGGGIVLGGTLVGEVKMWPWDTLPARFVWANGQAISRTTYPELFLLWGTVFGVGDASTTFNVPDLRGRVFAGEDAMGGAAAAARLTAASLGGTATLGRVGGGELLHGHTHSITDPTHNHATNASLPPVSTPGVGIAGGPVGWSFGVAANTAAATGISVVATGGGTSQNVQPTFVGGFIIYAGH